MRDFLGDITSVYWWLSVGVASILFNLVSAYLKPRLDTYLSAASTGWQTRTEAKRRAFQARVAMLRASPHEQAMLSHRYTRLLVRTGITLNGGLVLAMCLEIVPSLVGMPVPLFRIAQGFALGMPVAATYWIITDDSALLLRASRVAHEAEEQGT